MTHFPQQLKALPKFDGPFDAHKLTAQDCDVLFASYPQGTEISPHTHDTDNVGVITQGELILSMNGEEHRYQPGGWCLPRPSMRPDLNRKHRRLSFGSKRPP